MKPTARITVIGSSNTDLVIHGAVLPRPGETVSGGRFHILPGGKGANQAVAAARAGARVTFIANIGKDDFGNQSLQRLRKEGLRLHHIARSTTSPSGTAIILVDKHGENLISVARSSNDELTPNHIRKCARAILNSDLLLLQLEIPIPAVLECIRIASRHGIPILLNPAPFKELPPSTLRQIHWLTPNESELASVTRQPVASRQQIMDATARLSAKGIPNIIVTCGPRGVLWLKHGGKPCWFKVPKVKTVDTVGAGDCFSATLAVGLAEGLPEKEAISMAISASALSVQRQGAQTSMPYRYEYLLCNQNVTKAD